MNELNHATRPLLERLRRGLPASARARQPLLDYLQSRQIIGPISPILRIVNVFPGDHSEEIMCQFMIEGDARARFFVAPLTQIALDRKHSGACGAVKAIAPRRRRFGAGTSV